MFKIEDERHAELQEGDFATLEDAISELKRRARISWDEPPNQAPCESWRTCGRTYGVVEHDDNWNQLSCTYVLEISASGVTWLDHNSQVCVVVGNYSGTPLPPTCDQREQGKRVFKLLRRIDLPFVTVEDQKARGLEANVLSLGCRPILDAATETGKEWSDNKSRKTCRNISNSLRASSTPGSFSSSSS